MKPPTKEDWGDGPKCLDEQAAFQNFHGKSFEEAVALFEKCALIYQEDVTYMPEKPFKFYLRAFISYLESDKAKWDSDGASSFLYLIEAQVRTESAWLDESWEQIELLFSRLVELQEDFFEASPSIYGDFQKRIDRTVANREKKRNILTPNS